MNLSGYDDNIICFIDISKKKLIQVDKISTPSRSSEMGSFILNYVFVKIYTLKQIWYNTLREHHQSSISDDIPSIHDSRNENIAAYPCVVSCT